MWNAWRTIHGAVVLVIVIGCIDNDYPIEHMGYYGMEWLSTTHTHTRTCCS